MFGREQQLHLKVAYILPQLHASHVGFWLLINLLIDYSTHGRLIEFINNNRIILEFIFLLFHNLLKTHRWHVQSSLFCPSKAVNQPRDLQCLQTLSTLLYGKSLLHSSGLSVPPYQKPHRVIAKHLLSTQLSKWKPLIPLWGLDLLSVSPFPSYCRVIKQSCWPALPDVVTAGLSGAAAGFRRELQMLQFPLPCEIEQAAVLRLCRCLRRSSSLKEFSASHLLQKGYVFRK